MRKPDKMTDRRSELRFAPADRDNVSEKCNRNTGTEIYFTIIFTSYQLGNSRSV